MRSDRDPIDGGEGGLSRLVGRNRKKIEQQLLLLRELIRDPREMGTLFPSSAALADEMADSVPESFFKSGVFVELGAGTGPVTDALLKHGVPPERLFVVEKSPALAECLEKRFPRVQVLCCDAGDLRAFIPEGESVRAVISSLPFRSIPAHIGRSIMSAIEDILAPGGFYVQFTYALIGEMPFVPGSFKKIRSHFVLYNIPPAKVEVFRKPKGCASLQDQEGLLFSPAGGRPLAKDCEPRK